MVVYYGHIREIRNLKWSDFSEDLTYISLAGNKIKSKRNRVVPVPIYIRENLVKGELNHNIFSNTIKLTIETILRVFGGVLSMLSLS